VLGNSRRGDRPNSILSEQATAITEMNRIHLVLFDMNNRKFGPHLAAMDRGLISVMSNSAWGVLDDLQDSRGKTTKLVSTASLSFLRCLSQGAQDVTPKRTTRRPNMSGRAPHALILPCLSICHAPSARQSCSAHTSPFQMTHPCTTLAKAWQKAITDASIPKGMGKLAQYVVSASDRQTSTVHALTRLLAEPHPILPSHAFANYQDKIQGNIPGRSHGQL
jgi:hypothetical protein